MITFDEVTGEGTTLVGSTYAVEGVTYGGVFYGYATTYAGYGWPGSAGGIAADFADNSCPCYNDVTVTFAAGVQRAGFDVIGNNGDTIELTAYRGGVSVDDQTAPLAIPGGFVGIDLPAGFDALVIHTFGPRNGAFAMDDFRFDGHVARGARGATWVAPPPHLAVCSVPGDTTR